MITMTDLFYMFQIEGSQVKTKQGKCLGNTSRKEVIDMMHKAYLAGLNDGEKREGQRILNNMAKSMGVKI